MLNSILRYFRTLPCCARRRRCRTQPTRACKLQLEALEDRCLPSYAAIDLGTLPGYETSEAKDINAAGHVVGNATDSDTHTEHAFFWDESNGMIDLGTLGGSRTFAYAMNDAGQVVGKSQTGAMDAFGNP